MEFIGDGNYPENHGKFPKIEETQENGDDDVGDGTVTEQEDVVEEKEEPKEEKKMKNLWDFKGFIKQLWADKAQLMWTVIICLVVFLLGAVSC
jgi:hypothetical protein